MSAAACGVLAAVLLAGGLAGAQAQPYPSRPVRLIVPTPPGGGTDLVARTVGARLGEALGQTFVVENRPGANNIIGTEALARAKPDGHTLGVVIATHAINPALYRALPYDSAKDFAPVSLLAEYPFILAVHPALPARTVKDFVALARARPGQLVYASSGNGSGPHLAMELFRSSARIELTHVPYKGAGPATVDLVSGQVQAMFNNLLAGLPMIRAGKLRVLAISSAQRSPAAPELPTMAESGVPGFAVTGWYGMLAPAGTPRETVARLQGEIAKLLKVRDVNERLAGEGAQPVGGTPEAFAAFLQAETAKWAKAVAAAGLKPESL